MDILGGSAFVKNTKSTCGKVLRGRKTNESHYIPQEAALEAVDLLLQRVYRRYRQKAE